MTQSTKVLVLDLETKPALGYIWRLWDNNVGLNQLVEDDGVICWAAKWAGEDWVYFDSVWMNTEEGMLQNIWQLLDEADVVVGWNSDRFDLAHLNAHFAKHGMGPPSSYKGLDLMKRVKNKMKFLSNKLDYVSQKLGVGRKLETGGFELWLDVMAGDKKAQALMREYNEHDVLLTEEVYEKLRPWLPQVVPPSHGMTCPECGSTHLQSRGFAKTVTSSYKRFQCQECGSWSRSVVAEKQERSTMLRKESL